MSITGITLLRTPDAPEQTLGPVKTCCVLYPPFADETDLANNLYRAVWYLAGMLKDDGLLVVPQHFEAEGDPPLPAHLDPEIETVFRALRSRIVSCGTDELLDVVRAQRADSAILLCHKEDAWTGLAGIRNAYPWSQVVRVDPEGTQYESSFYLKLTSNDGAGTRADVRLCRERLRAMAAELDTERIFIFGTGPSLDGVDFDALPKGEKIVTNSMVVNPGMMEKIRPRVIVASDPIFHAGCSSYAGEFRRNLVEAMREYGSYFVFPMRDIGVYRAHLPEDLQERLIGIPLVGSGNLNQRLPKAFHVSTAQNVMTLLLLPIATSLSKDVVLAGFDGRPISESSYFWQHSQGAQLHHRMEEIKAAHPAFFKISYNDYLFRHMRCVARYLDEAEAAGVRITSLTDSRVPAIKGRFVDGGLDLALSDERPAVSIVMPCHNAAEDLPSTLASIFDQSLMDWELICVDDGSTDETFEVLSRYAAMDERIVVVRQENAGASAARNAALARARGTYLCFLDADDLMLPGSLLTRCEKARRSGRDTIVFGTTVIQDERGRSLNLTSGAGERDAVTFEEFAEWPSALHTGLGPAHLFKAKRFRPGLAYCEDWLYFAEIARTGVRFVNCKQELTAYRWHAQSVTQRNFKKAILDTSIVFRELTSDDWENEMLEPQYAAGLDPVVFHQLELRRMYGMLLMSIFRQDAAEAEGILDFIRRKERKRPLEKFVVNEVERAAVRTFFKPLHSQALYHHVFLELGRYRKFVAEHVDAGMHRVFVEAFNAFCWRVEKAVQGGDELQAQLTGAYAPAPAAFYVPPADVPQLTAQQRFRKAVYRRVKRIPLLGPAVVATRRRIIGEGAARS